MAEKAKDMAKDMEGQGECFGMFSADDAACEQCALVNLCASVQDGTATYTEAERLLSTIPGVPDGILETVRQRASEEKEKSTSRGEKPKKERPVSQHKKERPVSQGKEGRTPRKRASRRSSSRVGSVLMGQNMAVSPRVVGHRKYHIEDLLLSWLEERFPEMTMVRVSGSNVERYLSIMGVTSGRLVAHVSEKGYLIRKGKSPEVVAEVSYAELLGEQQEKTYEDVYLLGEYEEMDSPVVYSTPRVP